MKRIITLVFAAIFALSVSEALNAQIWSSGVLITFDQVNENAAIQQFKKTGALNKIDLLNGFYEEAERRYLEIEDLEEMYDLRDKLDAIGTYYMKEFPKLPKYKRQLPGLELKYRNLERRISRTIREATGGTTIDVRANSFGFTDPGTSDME